MKRFWSKQKSTPTATAEAARPIEVHLPFRFHISEVMDVGCTNEMMGHHFTILAGRLTDGTIKLHQRISVPTQAGLIPTYVLMLECWHKLVDEVASPVDNMAIAVWASTVRYDEVVTDTVEWCETERPVDQAERLRSHPTLFLHRADDWNLCERCLGHLSRIPHCTEILRELAGQDSPDYSDLARIALTRLESRT